MSPDDTMSIWLWLHAKGKWLRLWVGRFDQSEAAMHAQYRRFSRASSDKFACVLGTSPPYPRWD